MKRIFVIKEKCNACMNCVVACQKSHAGSRDGSGFYVSVRDTEPSRIHLQAVQKSPVPLVCMHCEEPACVKACITGAMQKDPVTGIVSNEFVPGKCIGCWMCVMACPYGVILPKQDQDHKVAVKCDLCMNRSDKPGIPACVNSCPTGAIVYMTEEEFAEYKRNNYAPLAANSNIPC